CAKDHQWVQFLGPDYW
nr:immunoglobulin heavy chain junction region [Macaca mulatta]MOY24421.1 immunoglobulin heavy chain junction region [Macaca mulatta]